MQLFGKLVIDESQEANVNNDSQIWLCPVKGVDTLINTTKMLVNAEYGVQDTGDQY